MLFRVVQESLTNVARHSGATQRQRRGRARMRARVRLVVEDDGRGFDPSAPTIRFGLAGIRERVEMLGGQLRIESSPGGGTAVVVDLEIAWREPSPIRILLVDDHAVLPRGAAAAAGARGGASSPSARPATAEDAMRSLPRLQPDVVGDRHRDARHGRARGRRRSSASGLPDARILFLSMHDQARDVRAAFDAGRRRLPAQVGRGRGPRARRPGGGGRRAVRASVARRGARGARVGDGPLGELTAREREVLRLLALGHTNQEIAESLIVSVRTVESHRAHVMTKLRVTTRAGLVRAALDAGLLDEER